MAEASKGLPMTAKWDPEKLQQEVAALEALEGKPFFARATGYIKRTGPGLLQSAMTLGAGSAAASVMAGASFGYKLLWIQPVAMFLGVMMLVALGNVVLTTGERPYKAFGRQTAWLLVFLWALGTVMASVIWHFPQYGLAAGAVRDLGNLANVETEVSFIELPKGTYFTEATHLTKATDEQIDEVRDKLGPSASIVTGLSDEQWETAKSQAGVKPVVKFTSAGLTISWLTGLAILAINVFTVFSYGSASWGIKLYEWFLRGVIALVIIAFGIVVFAKFGNIDWVELGKGLIGYYGIPDSPGSTTLVLGMLGAAVGINMTFLYPYSLLAKGWGKNHKKLARWDLGMSMFLPFVLVTSFVILAMTVSGVYDPNHEFVRTGMKPLDASVALESVMGQGTGRIIFDLGLLGMTCGAISTHMVVCGFTICEMFNLEYTAWRFRLFALVPAVGIFGVVAGLPIWFPIAASAICFTMLPIAYLIFLIMNNKRSYIGDAVGSGLGRFVFNLILVIALAVATIGSVIKFKGGVIDKVKNLLADKPAATEVKSEK